MPRITAVLHTENDAPRLGRALETLFPCAELLIVDHCSGDSTLRIAREYGARIVPAESRAPMQHYLGHARYDWILCLHPSESITEALQASLLEWSSLPDTSIVANAFALFVREQIDGIWRQHPVPQTRLVPRDWSLWKGWLPAHETSPTALEGELLRIAFP
jgi:glycosyltransferase involved in cell wall biosynthesis